MSYYEGYNIHIIRYFLEQWNVFHKEGEQYTHPCLASKVIKSDYIYK